MGQRYDCDVWYDLDKNDVCKMTLGFLAVAAKQNHFWIGNWIVVAAVLSFLGLFNASLNATARSLWALGCEDEHGARLGPRALAHLNPWFGSPDVAICFCAVCTAVFQQVNLGVIFQVQLEFMKIDLTSCFCQVDVWFNLLSLFFEVGALLKLRWSRPDHERLFRVPGGVAGVLLVSALISGVAIAVMYTIEWKVCVSCYPTAANQQVLLG